MPKKLSDQLAGLQTRVKAAQASLTKAETEAKDKLAARRAKAHADATAAVQKVDHEVKDLQQTAADDWRTARTKVDADMASLKARASGIKHDADAKRADHQADRLERRAGFAIDYATAAVEQANLAVLDAVGGRSHAQTVAKS